MGSLVRIADSKGRISLPGFANATVILEAISPNEFRVRKAEIIPADDLEFSEEKMPLRLSKPDAQKVLESLLHPPRPPAASRRAAKRFRKRHGRMGD